MKLSKQSCEILQQGPGKLGLFKQIERGARVCYKSEDRITDTSYQGMLDMLKANGHFSALEHGTVYLMVPLPAQAQKYLNNRYSRVNFDNAGYYITTNYRVILEHDWEDDLKYLCELTNKHARRVTVHFTSDIGVNREANRHRVNSICEESTIYCNYSKDKFGNEIKVSQPVWIDDYEIKHNHLVNADARSMFNMVGKGMDKIWTAVDYWLAANMAAEFFYMNLLRCGWKPKQARTILPLDTKSELIHTAYLDEWCNFFFWRCGEAHPQIKALACELRELFIKEGCAPAEYFNQPKKLIKD
ncbi:MAG: FAD-dependent thymidylate synthase [Turicibacter sp.]|nr:FAD-dependent thymidylate synthase [Turicibacter sp.]